MEKVKIIKTELPFPPYNVNSYLVKTKKNRILFDSCLNIESEIEKILSAIKKEGGVDLIILSHGHLDHAGSANVISKELDIPIYISYEEKARITNGVFERMDRRAERIMKILDFFQFDKESSEKERQKLNYYKTFMAPIDVFFNLKTIKDEDIEIIELPGHTEGSIGLYLKEESILFSGDAFLKEGISSFFDVERLTDTFTEYLNSLEKIERLSPKTVLPGHFNGFSNVKEVINNHRNSTLERVKKIHSLLDEGKSLDKIKEEIYPPNQNILIILSEIIYALEKKGVNILKEIKNILP